MFSVAQSDPAQSIPPNAGEVYERYEQTPVRPNAGNLLLDSPRDVPMLRRALSQGSALSCLATVKMTVSNFRQLKRVNRINWLAFSFMMEWD